MRDYVTAVILYVSFFSLIGFAIYMTGSLAPLWALLLTPSFTGSDGKIKKEGK
ncbi:hypothetical protein H8D04_00635 [bacterium]|nr:hypothetical protein [bacterium]